MPSPKINLPSTTAGELTVGRLKYGADLVQTTRLSDGIDGEGPHRRHIEAAQAAEEDAIAQRQGSGDEVLLALDGPEHLRSLRSGQAIGVGGALRIAAVGGPILIGRNASISRDANHQRHRGHREGQRLAVWIDFTGDSIPLVHESRSFFVSYFLSSLCSFCGWCSLSFRHSIFGVSSSTTSRTTVWATVIALARRMPLLYCTSTR